MAEKTKEMPDTAATIAEVVVEAAPAKDPNLMTLDEFCQTLSAKMKKVEIISGFHYQMRVVEKLAKATEATFQERFETFRKMPA